MSFVQIASTVLGSLGGLGGIGAGAAFLWKAWAGRQERRARRAQAEAQDLDLAFTRMVRAGERQDSEIARQDARIDRLSTRDRENRSRIEKLEESNRALAAENRTFREVVIGVMERLRRKPPDTPESILDYILTILPHFGRDQNP